MCISRGREVDHRSRRVAKWFSKGPLTARHRSNAWDIVKDAVTDVENGEHKRDHCILLVEGLVHNRDDCKGNI